MIAFPCRVSTAGGVTAAGNSGSARARGRRGRASARSQFVRAGEEQAAGDRARQAVCAEGETGDVARQRCVAHGGAGIEAVDVREARRHAWRALEEFEAGAEIGEAGGIGMSRGLLRPDAVRPQQHLVVDAGELAAAAAGRPRSRSPGSTASKRYCALAVTTVTLSVAGTTSSQGSAKWIVKPAWRSQRSTDSCGGGVAFEKM